MFFFMDLNKFVSYYAMIHYEDSPKYQNLINKDCNG
jgi:hypothetical protein